MAANPDLTATSTLSNDAIKRTHAMAIDCVATAMAVAVITSIVNAVTAGKTVRLDATLDAYVPPDPAISPLYPSAQQDVFHSPSMTQHLRRAHAKIEQARQMTLLAAPALETGAKVAICERLAEAWQQVCGELRALLITIGDMNLLPAGDEQIKLVHAENQIKAARYGKWPCVRSDGVVVAPDRAERRGDVRLPCQQMATLTCARGPMRVIVNDISLSGMGLSGCPSLLKGSSVTVSLKSGRTFDATVAWSLGGNIGAMFDVPLSADDALFRSIWQQYRAGQPN